VLKFFPRCESNKVRHLNLFNFIYILIYFNQVISSRDVTRRTCHNTHTHTGNTRQPEPQLKSSSNTLMMQTSPGGTTFTAKRTHSKSPLFSLLSPGGPDFVAWRYTSTHVVLVS